MNTGTLRQILLITDGCSNQGESPLISAKRAFEAGIVVNVIGVLDEGATELDDSYQEITDIALHGGGISQIVYEEELSQTVQAVTRQAMSQTIQGLVNRELTNILGTKQTIEEVDPEKRGEIIEVVEELGETCALEVLILVDTSASMQHKLNAVKEALFDLSYNLQARSGNNLFAIYQYPAENETIKVVTDWAAELASVSMIFPKLITGGVTPTGPALREALHVFARKEVKGRRYRESFSEER